MPDLSTEDQKLVILARATRARIRAAEGAAVR
ncbi:cytidine deaminase, partial [Pimelobacter simplex]|nr:cytidine deaminase [Pimelobacter simplex]